MKKYLAALLCACLLAGCSSTIGNKSNPALASFKVGHTTKNQVAEKLGLPAAITRSDDGTEETWAYQKSPKLAGLYLVVPTGSVYDTFYEITARFPRNRLPKDVAAVYVFDSRGILANVQSNPDSK